MRLPEHIRDAIRANETTELREELLKLLNSGATHDEVFQALEAFRAELRDTGDERAEDATMDLMDLFVGWCAPQYRL